MWSVTAEMAPYLLFGFLMAGFISVFLSPEWVERHLGGRGLSPILKAVLFGIPLPLCSCSVIPVTASIRNHGASRGATTGFLLATPQTGVDSIVATWGVLGPVFAVFRALAALVTGIIGGSIVSVVEKEASGSANSEDAAKQHACQEECCATRDTEARWKRGLRYAFITLPRDIGKALAVGILVAGLLAALVPPGFFVEYLGGGLLAMLVMMAVGIPIYVCATASIPLALGFIHLGASPGAALVFLVAGPATNAATLATVFKVLGKRTALVYLITVALGALAAGFGLDASIHLLGELGFPADHTMHKMTISWWQHVSAVLLLAVLGTSLWRGWQRKATLATSQALATDEEDIATEDAVVLRIDGMTCEHCTNSVQRGLLRSPGVAQADVDLASGRATVRGEDLDTDTLRQVVRDLGYEVGEPTARA
jgi:uncharacterized membrane protein YraQ (UPF0718 family)/copper chaperone CopZ